MEQDCFRLAFRTCKEDTRENMNEVISKLYEIEETAENILNNAKRARDNLQNELKLQEQAYERELMHDLEHRLEKKSRELKEQADREIEAMAETYGQQRLRLDERYDQHLSELADGILKRITEV